MSTSTEVQPTHTQETTTVPAIEAVDVHKVYDTGSIKVHALRGVNFSVQPGEMVAVMGASGSGKTTLLNCLSGLDSVTSGVSSINGTDLADLTDNERTDYRANNMGFIFQTFNLLPVLTAVENVELPLVVSGTPAKEARERAMAMLDQVGLADWAHHKPAELSGGQGQRVTVARALVNNPAIVWADEPTGALDSETAANIMHLIRELNEVNKQTFLLVTHDPRVAAVCRRLVRMKDGEIVSDEPVAEAFSESNEFDAFDD